MSPLEGGPANWRRVYRLESGTRGLFRDSAREHCCRYTQIQVFPHLARSKACQHPTRRTIWKLGLRRRRDLGRLCRHPELRQPLASSGQSSRPARNMRFGNAGVAPCQVAPVGESLMLAKHPPKRLESPPHAFLPNGSSKDGLWGVNNSAPFSVTCRSSSRRMPNSPRM